ncbi:MAG TPA: protein kinase [Bryobacteraceae bacterium]|nr:protein kinase [Bryobacteraceae bacterium]
MTPEIWTRVKEILHHALALAPAERAAYLDQACAGDAALRAEVESLLASQHEAGTFIDRPVIAADDVSQFLPEEADLRGTRLGVYEIVQSIGEGGMGSVYQAVRDDDQFRKVVAIKLVKPGMDSDFVLGRFHKERQILAHLDHPNIAKVFDAGTTPGGRPYFVMEFIPGLPIDEYCDQKGLSVSERLRLFRQVCSAVQYAHQNLIVHRDLKPNNILVTPEGTPKLLDFGIAKLLDADTGSPESARTMTLHRVMTPDYASPEQVRGEAITTASDIYSLGVMLYELLTGHRPYRVTSVLPLDIAEVVCVREPEKPSTAVNRVEERYGVTITPDTVSRKREGAPEKLRRRLRGDLDNIILMALRKDPKRRYASVEQFSEDLRRHLAGLPVIARADTLAYRTSKFVRRNKVAVAAAGLLLVTLTGGIAATAWQARIASLERARAERRFNEVRKLAGSFLFELHDSIRDLPGSTPARELIVRRALQYLNNLAREAGNDASLTKELASAYERVGDVQGNPRFGNLGDTRGAIESYRKALALRTAMDSSANDPALRRDLVSNQGKLSDLLWVAGDPANAVEAARRRLEIARKLSDVATGNADDRFQFGIAYVDYGWKLAATKGDFAGALTNCRAGLRVLEQIPAPAKPDPARLRGLGSAYSKTGDILAQDPKTLREGLQMYHKALASHKAALALDPTNGTYQRGIITDYNDIGDALASVHEDAAALRSYRSALAGFDALRPDPKDMQVQQDRAFVLGNIGEMLLRTGSLEDAARELERSLAILNSLHDPGSVRVNVRYTIAADEYRLGQVNAALAARPGQSPAVCRRYWERARGLYKSSHAVFADLRDRGIAVGIEAAKADEVARDLARAEKELRTLQAKR